MGEHSLDTGEDTQPLELEDLPTGRWQVEWDNQAWSKEMPTIPLLKPTVVHVRTPEPALIRGLLMAVGGLTLMVALRDASASTLEPYLRIYIGVGPLILSWWIRMSVTPAATLKETV